MATLILFPSFSSYNEQLSHLHSSVMTLVSETQGMIYTYPDEYCEL